MIMSCFNRGCGCGCRCGCGCGNGNGNNGATTLPSFPSTGVGGATDAGYALVCTRVPLVEQHYPVTLPSFPDQGVGGAQTGSNDNDNCGGCCCCCCCHCMPHNCRG